MMAVRRTRARKRSIVRLVRYNDLRLGYYLDLALRVRRRMFLQELRRCQRRCSEPAVHDLRVATRRIIAVLDLLRALAPSALAEKSRRQFRRVLKMLGPLRDTQVQILRIQALLPQFPVLEPFCTVMKLRERRSLKQIAHRLLKVNQAQMRVSIRQCLNHLRRLVRNPRVRKAAEFALQGALAAGFTRVASMKNQLKRQKPESIHALRVTFKRFRYLSEILQPELGKDIRKAMNAYQTEMGEIHDAEVLVETVKTFVAQQPESDSLRSALQELESEFGEKVAAFMRSGGGFQAFQPVGVSIHKNTQA